MGPPGPAQTFPRVQGALLPSSGAMATSLRARVALPPFPQLGTPKEGMCIIPPVGRIGGDEAVKHPARCLARSKPVQSVLWMRPPPQLLPASSDTALTRLPACWALGACFMVVVTVAAPANPEEEVLLTSFLFSCILILGRPIFAPYACITYPK